MKSASRILLGLLAVVLPSALVQAEANTTTVQVMQSEEYGAYLTDGEGRTLYLFVDKQKEQEGPDSMTEGVRDAAAPCSKECQEAWPPATVEGDVQAGEGVNRELLYVADVDGRSQVTYNGWPLYYFVRDEQPGQINGQEIESFGGEWYLISPEGHQVEEHEEGAEGKKGDKPAPALTVTEAKGQELGQYLADAEGKSLYLFMADSQGESTCYEQCANAWPPFLADITPLGGEGTDSSLVGELTRKDGSTQVTYNGWPLYYYKQDENAGDVEGQDIEGFGAEWYLVTPAGQKVEEKGGHDEGEKSTEGNQVAAGPTVGLELIAEGLTHPVMLAEPPDDSGRLFIADQVGQIWIVTADGKRVEQPFLDIEERLVKLKAHYDERGLLGLAFHPDYANNGRFFVYYSAPLREEAPGDFDHTSHLSEFTVSTDDPDRADPDSERILLHIDQPQSNHNAGTLAFGPDDGFLYVSLGDGGNADDEGTGHVDDWYADNDGGNGQDLTENLLGGILRLDVDGVDPYGVPSDNPFVDSDVLPEQYAYGFRNPYRFSFDMGGDGALYVGDAGQTLWEEIDLVTAGGNYGWNIKEGTHCFDSEDPDDPPDSCPDTVGSEHSRSGDALVNPIIQFRNASAEGGGLGLVIIGGYVYRGSAIPDLMGRYLFGTWSRGKKKGESGEEKHMNGAVFVADTGQGEGLWEFQKLQFAESPDGELQHFLFSLAQDRDGEMYVLTADEPGPMGETGKVYRLIRSAD